MKKIISIILLIILLFGFVPIVNADTTDNVKLTVNETTVGVGDTVLVTMKIAQVIQATDFKINYSSDILKFENTSVGEDFCNVTNAGVIQVSAYKTSGFDTFTFTFRTTAKGIASISTDIEALNIDQTDGNTLPFENQTVNITVQEAPTTIDVTEVTLDKTTASLKEGEALTLTATVTPSDATDKTVTWKSSDTSVATVSNGTITAIKAGTTTITATAGTKSATCKVTITEKEIKPTIIEVTNLTLDKTTASLKEGESLKIKATVTPSDATDKTITWKSSDTSVATVTNGEVKALKEGEVTITATAGKKSATCKITVTKKETTSDNKDYLNKTYSNFKEAYKKILNSITNSKEETYYALHDIDNNGTPELIITDGYIESEKKIYFYSFAAGKIISLKNMQGGHTYLIKDKNYLYLLWAHMGSEVLYQASIKNNQLELNKILERELKEGESYTWTKDDEKYKGLEFNKITNIKPIDNWNITSDSNKDTTTAPGKIPQTGERLTIVGFVIVTLGIAVLSIIRYRKYRDI